MAAAFAISTVLAGASDPLDARVARYSLDPNAQKISVQLLRLESQVKAGTSNLRGAAKSEHLSAAGGALAVQIVCSPLGADVEAKLSVPGVKVTGTYPEYSRADALMNDLSALHVLAAIPEVSMIRASLCPRTRGGSEIGLVDGRAPRALRADLARSSTGLDGSGQKIGILSDSFAATDDVRDSDTQPALGVPGTLTGTKPQDTGDLPPTVDLLKDFTGDEFGNGEDEGAAMAELVHDIAPGAGVAFYTAFVSDADFANGITQLSTAAGCSIVVDDVGYFEEPVYQNGIIGQAATACVGRGVPYFSACGNDANLDFRQSYLDVDPTHSDRRTLAGNDLHNWGNGSGFLPVIFPPNSLLVAVLNWNQPFQSLNLRSGAQADLDLYLTATPDAAGLANPLTASTEIQGRPGRGRGDALEELFLSNDGSTTITAYLAVNRVKGFSDHIPQSRSTPLEINLGLYDIGTAAIIVPGIPSGDSAFGGPSIVGHPQSPGVVSVAAIPWWESPQFNPAFQPTANIDPEFYTSRGGAMTQFFDPAGKFAPRTSLQPVISAVDGCDTTFFFTSDDIFLPGHRFGFIFGYEGEPDGYKNFFGTSAAAPNAAAVAALIKQGNPSLTPADITAVLQTTAIDVTGKRAAPGIDDVTGPGLIDAKAAVDLATGP